MFPSSLPRTLQGFFDNAWRWAVIEKHPPAFKSRGLDMPISCLYRKVDEGNETNPNACLIGCSIPEFLYNPEIENKAVNWIVAAWGLDYSLRNPLVSLQRVHDSLAVDINKSPALEVFYSDIIETRLRRFAENENLTIPTVG